MELCKESNNEVTFTKNSRGVIALPPKLGKKSPCYISNERTLKMDLV